LTPLTVVVRFRFSVSKTLAVSVVEPQPVAVIDVTVGCWIVPPAGVIVSPPGTSRAGSAMKSPATTASFWMGFCRLLAVAKNSDIGVFGVTSGPPTLVRVEHRQRDLIVDEVLAASGVEQRRRVVP
jgi:hypothetical protein